MSVQTLEPYINCSNKDESIESILKRLISVSSSDKLYLNTDAALYLSTQRLSGTFVDGDLVNVVIDSVSHRVLLVTHNFGTSGYDYVIRDNNGNMVGVQDSVIDNDSSYFIIDDTITGTWSYHLFVI